MNMVFKVKVHLRDGRPSHDYRIVAKDDLEALQKAKILIMQEYASEAGKFPGIAYCETEMICILSD